MFSWKCAAKKAAVKLVAGGLALTAIVSPAFAVTGTVDAGDGLRLRAGAGTDQKVITLLADKTEVDVIGTAENGWYQVTWDNETGFVSPDYLIVAQEAVQDLPQVAEPTYGRTTDVLHIRSGPSTEDERIGQLSRGAVVTILEEKDGWYRLQRGYISADYVTQISAEEASNSGKGSDMAEFALSLVGCPYVYGGNSPKGFDCSGFVKYVANYFGHTVARTASDQMENGTPVSWDELQPGDLVFFKKSGSSARRASHVGIYIGGGQFVHASTSRVGVIVSGMNEAYYTSGFVGARRLG